MDISNYLKNKILNWMKASAFASAPATVYLTCYSNSANDDNSGTENILALSGSANRVAISWSAISSNESMTNNGAITLISGAVASGTIVSIGLFDAQTGGNLLMWTDLSVPLSVGISDDVSVADGDLEVLWQ